MCKRNLHSGLEKEVAPHCSILAWESPWTEGPGGLQLSPLGRKESDTTEQLSVQAHGRHHRTVHFLPLFQLPVPREGRMKRRPGFSAGGVFALSSRAATAYSSSWARLSPQVSAALLLPPSLARLPLPPSLSAIVSLLFSLLHTALTVSGVRHSERRGPHRCPALTSFPCPTSHGPTALSSRMSPWNLRLKGFQRELPPPQKICFCDAPQLCY